MPCVTEADAVDGHAVALEHMDLFDKLLLVNDTQGGELDRLVLGLALRPWAQLGLGLRTRRTRCAALQRSASSSRSHSAHSLSSS